MTKPKYTHRPADFGGTINPLFIEILNADFTNQFIVEPNEGRSYISFPPKSSDFGGIDICEVGIGEYIVYVGLFTHTHYGLYRGSDEEKVEEAANEISEFLGKIFADCIICYGGGSWGGWFAVEDKNESYNRISDCDLFVWSGKYELA